MKILISIGITILLIIVIVLMCWGYVYLIDKLAFFISDLIMINKNIVGMGLTALFAFLFIAFFVHKTIYSKK